MYRTIQDHTGPIRTAQDHFLGNSTCTVLYIPKKWGYPPALTGPFKIISFQAVLFHINIDWNSFRDY